MTGGTCKIAAASLMTMFYGMRGAGQWLDRRDRNVIDAGCKDGAFMVALGFDPATLPSRDVRED